MPRTDNANFIEDKNASENAPIFLYTIFDYDGAGNNFYFAEYDENVEFDSITYVAFPVTHDKIGENTSGSIDKVNITFGNVSRYLQAYLEIYDFREKKVEIKTVFANHLADTDALITDIYYIDAYSADQENVSLNLTSKFDMLNINVPIRKFTRNQCPWIYNSSNCDVGSSDFAAYPTCGRTLADCRLRNNSARFGGFPSVPDRNVYVG